MDGWVSGVIFKVKKQSGDMDREKREEKIKNKPIMWIQLCSATQPQTNIYFYSKEEVVKISAKTHSRMGVCSYFLDQN